MADQNLSGAGIPIPTAPSDPDGVNRLSKEDIQRLISHNSPRLSYLSNQDSRSKSEVWQRFKIVQIDQKAVNFVKCNLCNVLLVWKSDKGTSALRRHACGAAKSTGPNSTSSSSTAKIPKFQLSSAQRDIKDFTAKVVPAHCIKELNESIVIGLAKDLRPLRTVEGGGFQLIAQSLINFGATHGHQKASTHIMHRTTLKDKHLKSVIERKQREIADSLVTAPSHPKFAFTFGMWSDKYTQRHFLSLSIHWINQKWEKVAHTLAVNEFLDMTKSTANIRKDCAKILETYFDVANVPDIMLYSRSVTDGGSNMIQVFPNRYPCCCHRLNLVVQWTFNEKPAPDTAKIAEMARKGTPISGKKLFQLSHECPAVASTIKAVKSLVKYFKQSGLNTKLQYTLKQDVSTRWNSELLMLESYLKSAEDVKELLLKNNQLSRLTNVSDEVIQDLISFLAPFRECSDVLSGEKYPTFHLIALWFHTLKLHLQPVASDSDEMRRLRQQSLMCFDEYCHVEDIHYVACILHPMYRKLKFANEDIRLRTLELLQEMIDAEVVDQNTSGAGNTTENNPTPIASQVEQQDGQKPAKLSRFAEFIDSDEEIETEESEIQKYLALRLPEKDEDCSKFDLLGFWRGAAQFPSLRKLANWLLAIPASQASDERVFSSTGFTMSARRTQLSGSTLSSLTFVHKNY